MSGPSLLDELIVACDAPAETVRAALRQALRKSGVDELTPSAEQVRRVLPELRRAFEESMAPAKAYEAVERVDILLSLKPPEKPSAPPSLSELTRRLREANERMSERHFETEAVTGTRSAPRKSVFPGSK